MVLPPTLPPDWNQCHLLISEKCIGMLLLGYQTSRHCSILVLTQKTCLSQPCPDYTVVLDYAVKVQSQCGEKHGI